MSDKVIVTVNEGKIKGVKKTSSFSGVEYCSFLGVPYAQPPEGQLRFKDPVKVKPWKNGILDATTEKGGCRQFCIFQKEITGSEDCLYNNIHTPKLPSKGDPLKPVIAVVHPGGFLFGSADPQSYGSPEFVIHHDVVFVSISFRLHILGFLNLGLKECSGNQGIKDVLLSLKWIKDNIKVFGGDPDNITLLGSSSGSAIVHALMISPKAQGSFQKAVLMGMYATNPTLVAPKENMTPAFELALSLGYDGVDMKDKKKLLSFFKKIDIDMIITFKPESHLHEENAPLFPASMFVPMFDDDEDSILPMSALDTIKSTPRIPLLIGFCDKEAAMAFTRKFNKTITRNFYSTVRQNYYGWGRDLSNEDLKQMQKEIEKFYLNGNSVDNAPLSLKVDIQTDVALSDVYDAVINVIAADRPESVFVYRFDYEGNFSTMKDRVLALIDEPLEGSVHGCDYSYFVFMKEFNTGARFTLTEKSHKMVDVFTKLICTFATTGNPNYTGVEVQWEPSTIENPRYLSINEPLKLVNGKLNGERMEFWENLKRKYKKG
ncbi:juvenile hormone esterase-like [Planococcus citri]|uniref:juvenile hormone esterase-like n=1 Tax=Planococcus citri TaxID=170843 RepID=UPI0031F97F39